MLEVYRPDQTAERAATVRLTPLGVVTGGCKYPYLLELVELNYRDDENEESSKEGLRTLGDLLSMSVSDQNTGDV